MGGWKVTDYNPSSLKKKTTAAIEKEYARMRKTVSRRVATFEKHGLGGLSHVKAIKEVMKGNRSRRSKERAIVIMKRFLYLETSSYTKYKAYRARQVEEWREMDIDITAESYGAFTEFLEWAKSFFNGNYTISDIKEAWEQASGDLEDAIEFFSGMYMDEDI